MWAARRLARDRTAVCVAAIWTAHDLVVAVGLSTMGTGHSAALSGDIEGFPQIPSVENERSYE